MECIASALHAARQNNQTLLFFLFLFQITLLFFYVVPNDLVISLNISALSLISHTTYRFYFQSSFWITMGIPHFFTECQKIKISGLNVFLSKLLGIFDGIKFLRLLLGRRGHMARASVKGQQHNQEKRQLPCHRLSFSLFILPINSILNTTFLCKNLLDLLCYERNLFISSLFFLYSCY